MCGNPVRDPNKNVYVSNHGWVQRHAVGNGIFGCKTSPKVLEQIANNFPEDSALNESTNIISSSALKTKVEYANSAEYSETSSMIRLLEDDLKLDPNLNFITSQSYQTYCEHFKRQFDLSC